MAVKQPPPQHQDQQPGRESEMTPQPESEGRPRRGSGKLEGKAAIITGGDSGIGRAVAIAFARSLSGQLIKKGIRVNSVAPGPIWTPLIASTYPPEKVARFGQDVPMGRPGQARGGRRLLRLPRIRRRLLPRRTDPPPQRRDRRQRIDDLAWKTPEATACFSIEPVSSHFAPHRLQKNGGKIRSHYREYRSHLRDGRFLVARR